MASFLDFLIGNREKSGKFTEKLNQLKVSEGSKEEQQTKDVQERSSSLNQTRQNRTSDQTQRQNSRTTGSQSTQQQSNTDQRSNVNTSGTSSTTGITNTSTTGVSSTQSAQTISNLDEATTAALQSIMGQLTEKTGVLDQNSLNAILGNTPVLEALQMRGAEGFTDVDQIAEDARAAAILAFSENEAPILQQKANATGSEDNTLVAMLRNKAAGDLGAKVAAVEGNIRLAAADKDLAAMTAAISAGVTQGAAAGDVGGVGTIAQILKGAQTTATGSQSTQQSQQTSQQTSQQQQTQQQQVGTSSQSTSAVSNTQSAQESQQELTARISEAMEAIQEQQTMTQQLTQFLSSIFSTNVDATEATREGTSTEEQSGTLWDWLNSLRPRS